MYRRIAETIDEAVSAESVTDYCREIADRDRWFSFKHMYETAEYLATQMRELGLEAVEIVDVPATGEGFIEDMKQMWAWDAEEAIFELTLPDGSRERVADYQVEPCHLVMYSGPTPEEGISGELVFVDLEKQDEYSEVELAGKFILILGSAQGAMPLAERCQAAGILSAGHWNPELPDAVYWANTFADKSGVWGHTKADTTIPAMNISPNEGERIRRLIEENGGSLPCYCRIRTRFYEGSWPTVTGVIPGTDRASEEIILTGHPYENGATDNATGCAVRLELARALMHLVAEGKLKPPRRGIRFLFVGEGPGSVHWAQNHHEELKELIWAMELDCIGEDPTKTRNPLGVNLAGWARPSFVDGLLVKLLEEHMHGHREHYFTWWHTPNFYRSAHGGGNDGRLVAYGTRRPAQRFANANFLWHLSADTMDAVSPEHLAHITTVVATMAYLVASAGPEEASWLAEVAFAFGCRDIIAAAQKEIDALVSRATPELVRDACEYIHLVCDAQCRAIRGIERLVAGDSADEVLARAEELVAMTLDEDARQKRRVVAAVGIEPARPAVLTPVEEAMAEVVPTCLLCSAPMYLVKLPDGKRPPSVGQVGLWLDWMDGQRSLLEATRKLALELKKPGEPVMTEEQLREHLHPEMDLMNYAKLLKECGYLGW